MRRGARESVLTGIALVCLDISAAVIIVAWDLAQDLSQKACASASRQFNAASLRLHGYIRAFFGGARQISSLRENIDATLSVGNKTRE
jgi:hypothetical protein